MESFQWNEYFITGLGAVDDQHHHLVDLINELGDLIAGNAVDFAALETLVGELASYANYHFEEEERMMEEARIDRRHLDHHLNEHAWFLKEVTSMKRQLSPEMPLGAHKLLSFLTHWLAYHILGSDQDMAAQVNAIEQGVDNAAAFAQMEHERDNSTEPLLVALSGLFQQVSARNRELVQLNESLEEKVLERTAELSQANERLEVMANTDVLTGLANRRRALRRLAILWDEATELRTPISCIMIDADHFKEVNDEYGHDAGDQVLRDLAKTLHHAMRTDDMVSRLGGDEFFVVCPNTDHDGGMIVAEILRKTVSELRVPTGAGGYWEGSISLGLASRTPEMNNIDDLLKAADDSLYEAKRAGKNRVRSLH